MQRDRVQLQLPWRRTTVEGVAKGMDQTSREAGTSAGNGATDSIALCLSGGGLRATFFHLGVIVALRELGRLRDVREIFAVSGGSILAAHLLVNWSRYTGSDAEFGAAIDDMRAVADRDIRGRILRRWLLSTALLLPRLMGLDRSRLLSREYAAIFGRESLRHHARKHPSPPDIYLLSTIFNTGELCSFSQFDFAFESANETRRIDGDIVPPLLRTRRVERLPTALPADQADSGAPRDDIGGVPLRDGADGRRRLRQTGIGIAPFLWTVGGLG